MSIHFDGATSQYCSSISVASSAFATPAGSVIPDMKLLAQDRKRLKMRISLGFLQL